MAERVKMTLLTKAVASNLPPLYSQENESNPIAQARFYSVVSNWEWFATEFDGVDLFFGLVKGFETELGYFSLSEMKDSGLVVADPEFAPKPLSELR